MDDLIIIQNFINLIIDKINNEMKTESELKSCLDVVYEKLKNKDNLNPVLLDLLNKIKDTFYELDRNVILKEKIFSNLNNLKNLSKLSNSTNINEKLTTIANYILYTVYKNYPHIFEDTDLSDVKRISEQ